MFTTRRFFYAASMQSRLLSTIPGLIYGYSDRTDGNMRIDTAADLIRPERLTFFRTRGISPTKTAGCRLVHGTRIQDVPVSEARPLFFDQTDGLLTLDPSRVLTVTGADCFPVFVVDSKTRITGLCHAGWRGVRAGIVSELIQHMRTIYHSRPENLIAVIGPGIRACHFQVKLDVWSLFPPAQLLKKTEGTFIDLPALLREQIIGAGVPTDHLEDSGICTVCDARYFSYRREKIANIPAQIAYLGWQL
mgnify:CR=1 FL=1